MKLLAIVLTVNIFQWVDGLVSSGECHGYNASNTQGAMQNYVSCEINVMPGDVLHVSTCNQSTLIGDTYLRLFDPSNSIELAKGDDGCGIDRGGTSMTYVVPIAYPNNGVTLYLRQGCFSTFSCKAVTSYTLNVEPNPLPFPTPAPADDDRIYDDRNCPIEDCLDIHHPSKGWTRCDMCICFNFDKIFLSDYDHDCHADESLYMCMIKHDIKTVTCTTQMKPGWIAAFFFIGFCGFVIFSTAFSYIIYIMCFERPKRPIQPIVIPVREIDSGMKFPDNEMQAI